jgi:hypothetical protein
VIHFFVPEAGTFTIRRYLEVHGEGLRGRLEPTTYRSLWRGGSLPAGSCVFAAIDRLTASERRTAVELWETLRSAGPDVAMLNHPGRALTRLPLLQLLASEGTNRFHAFRASDDVSGSRYPVFVREANRHNGPLTGLLDGPRAVSRELRRLRWKGYDPDELLVVEFCDTSDAEGVYRKYAAYVVGDRIVPKSLRFSRHWMVKATHTGWNERRVEEEFAYLRDNPHEEALREIARRARIEYGRFDYSLRQGELQVWEINTNPTIGPGPRHRSRAPRDRYWELRQPGKRLFRKRFRRAWHAVDAGGDATQEIPFRLSPGRRARITAERSWRSMRAARRRWTPRIAGLRPLRPLRAWLDLDRSPS